LFDKTGGAVRKFEFLNTDLDGNFSYGSQADKYPLAVSSIRSLALTESRESPFKYHRTVQVSSK
jgi:hypothetical protein